MKTFALLFSLVILLPASSTDDDLRLRLIAFNKPYSAFVREFFGCPVTATDVNQCGGTGTIDYRLYKEMREKGKALLALHE